MVGTHALTLALYRADVGEGPPSAPFALTVPSAATWCVFEGVPYPPGTVFTRTTNRQNMQALLDSFVGWVWDDIRQLHQNQYVLTFACRERSVLVSGVRAGRRAGGGVD